MGNLYRRVFGISLAETRADRRGFRGNDPAARLRFETIGATFVQGYHAGLETGGGESLVTQLEAVELERRGFAYEGAAMALFLLDTLTPWRHDRWRTFLAGAGNPHAYMLHVGAGWAVARMGRSFERASRRMDPLLRWLVLDGWGFHDGYFHAHRALDQGIVPARIASGYARRAYDQGLGRALWFVESATVPAVAIAIEKFAADRRGDLWSGIGLAAAYAGAASDDALEELRDAAGPYLEGVAQGAAFAAQARHRAGNMTTHTDAACRALCGLGAAEAARRTDIARANLPATGDEPAYEIWRARLRHGFAAMQVMS